MWRLATHVPQVIEPSVMIGDTVMTVAITVFAMISTTTGRQRNVQFTTTAESFPILTCGAIPIQKTITVVGWERVPVMACIAIVVSSLIGIRGTGV